MLKVSINYNGTKIYRNAEGKIHRADGPARIEPNGNEIWHHNGDITYAKYHNGVRSHRDVQAGTRKIDNPNGRKLTKNYVPDSFVSEKTLWPKL